MVAVDKKSYEADKNKKEFSKEDKEDKNVYMDYVMQQFIKKYVFSNNS